jgi:hypothetical protein
VINKPPFTFRKISLGIRPPRLVVLTEDIDLDWQDTMLRILEWFSSCWGGGYALIVPTNGNTIDNEFWWLLEKYDPDYIYFYQKTMLDKKFSNADEYKSWLDSQAHQYMKQNSKKSLEDARKAIDERAGKIGIGHFIISENLQKELKERLNPFAEWPLTHGIVGESIPHYPLTSLWKAFSGMDDKQSILSPEIQVTKELQLCLYSCSGKLNEPLQLKKTVPDAFNLFPHSWNEDNIDELIQMVLKREKDFWRMPFPMTMAGLSFYSDTFASEEKLIIIVGKTLKEFCLYHALSRLKPHTYWLPFELVNQFSIAQTSTSGSLPMEGTASYLYWLRDIVEDVLKTKIEQKFYIYSNSLNEEEFDLFKIAFNKANIFIPKEPIIDKLERRNDVQSLIKGIIRTFEVDVPIKNYVEQFNEGESVNFLNTPIPKKFPRISPSSHFWLTDVCIERYVLPKVKTLGAKSVIYKNYDRRFVRVSAGGLSYFCPHFAYMQGWGGIENFIARPKLKLFEDFTIIEELFKESDYHIKYSDKGDYQRESCLKFRGCSNLEEFILDEKKRSLLLRYCDDSKSEEGKGIFLKSDGRRYLWFEEIKNIVDTDTRGVIDSLIENEIVYRGFIFQCKKCRNAAWYPIEEVTSRFKCSRCNSEQIFKQENWKNPPEEPRWYYKLDEVVYQGIKNNMHVPILTVRQLRKLFKNGFHYTPEIEVRKNLTAEKPDLEIDLVSVIDGEVYIGEATIENEIDTDTIKERNRLEKLREIAAKVRARKVVFATFSDSWSERSIRNVKEIFENSSCVPLFLAKTELLSS